MLCSLTGLPPVDPVVTPAGVLYERSIAEQAIEEAEARGGWTCVVTGEPVTRDQLIAVRTGFAGASGGGGDATARVVPRTTQATSIPGLLSILRNEWDATMLETYKVKQELLTTRKELSHALYQHDAACRVIARLVKERDEAQQALVAAATAPAPKRAAAGVPEGDAQPSVKRAKAAPSTEDDPAGAGSGFPLPDAVAGKLDEKAKVLVKGRKKRVVPESLATVDGVGSMKEVNSFPLHKTTKRGIFAIARSDDGGTVATGGADGVVVLLNVADGKVAGRHQGHKPAGGVRALQFVRDDIIASGGGDATVRVWKTGADGNVDCIVSEEDGAVSALHRHPTSDFFVAATDKGTWSFYDVAQSQRVARASEAGGAAFASASVHPDGLLLGTGGGDSVVRIWDLKQGKDVMSFPGHGGPVTGLAFSENGYLLAACAADCVKVWDLRKFKCVKEMESKGVSCVSFDHSGMYLAMAGAQGLDVVAPKSAYEYVLQVDDGARLPKGGVSSMLWENDARGMLLGGPKDHTLKLWRV